MNRTRTRSLRPRATVVVAGTAALAALLAGCGSASGTTASGSAGKAPAGSSGRAARAGFRGGLAGAIGSVGGGSFTVTPRSGGTATVDWTGNTTFTKTASGTLADVTVGSCVSVVEASGSDASTGSVDAAVVRITPEMNGSCARGSGAFPGGAGRFPRGSGSRPSGGAGSGGQGGGFARMTLFGSVASVSPSSFVVTVTTPGTSGSSAGTTTTAVDVSGSTTYALTTAASAADLSVGECAAVFSGVRPAAASGSAAPSRAPVTGPVTAVSVTLSAPVDGSCSTGFGRPGGVRGPGAAGAGSTGANA